jgi:fluoride exporter
MSVVAWIGAGLLGGAGALARFLVDGVIASRARRDFPAGTLVVNISGALVLGVLVGAGVSDDSLTLAGTAAIGSYTTFSTWMLETQRLTEEGETRSAAANLVISLAVGLAAIALGRVIGRHL